MGISDSVERFAFDFLGRARGVQVEPYDVAGRQGAVDGLLHYPDGGIAALEVSSVGPEPEARITNVLATGQHKRRPRGLRQTWIVQVPRDFHPGDLRKIDEVIVECDRLAATALRDLGHDDARVRTLLDAGVHAFAWRRDESTQPTIWVLAASIWGFVGSGIANLPQELGLLLRTDRMQSKLTKLVASGQTERHLFLLARPQAFSFPVFTELATDETLPDDPPRLPDALDHLWLTTEFQNSGIVHATASRWSRVPLDVNDL